MPLPTEGFLLEVAPGRVLVGEGPLTALPHRRPGELACYAPDFFQTEPSPWLHPAGWHVVSTDALLADLAPGAPPLVRWTPPDRAAYARTFERVRERIAAGTLTKAVPIVIERGVGAAPPDGPAIDDLVARALAQDPPAVPYAVWTATGGIVGATPEILFRRPLGGKIETVAMAGTVPVARAAEIAGDPKECREHESVVDDIVAALTPFGAVHVLERDVVTLTSMAHLKTDITLTLAAPADFMALVDALHPTAALGVAPRSAGLDLLRGEGADDRGRFGAPMGVEWADGRALAVVAIRNVQWDGTAFRLGAGAGVIAESRLDREWDELALKRAAVKDMFAL